MNGKVLPGDMHEHSHNVFGRIFHGFIHPARSARPAVDMAAAASAGARAATLLAAIVLIAAAAIALVGAAWSGSAALAAAAIGALAAAALALPLAVAASPIIEGTSKLFTYGREPAEDLAAIVIATALGVLALGAAALAVVRLWAPPAADAMLWTGVAGLIVAAAHIVAALTRWRAGRAAKSTTLAADGRATALGAVYGLLAAFAAWLVATGWPWADGAVGLISAALVLRALYQGAQSPTTRLLDGIEEDMTWRLARAAEEAGATAVTDVRARWAGHRLHAEITIAVPAGTPVAETRPLAGKVRAGLAEKFPALKRVAVGFAAGDAPKPPPAAGD